MAPNFPNKGTEHSFDGLFVKPDQEKINMIEKLAIKKVKI
jgi:hypothetical protein